MRPWFVLNPTPTGWVLGQKIPLQAARLNILKFTIFDPILEVVIIKDLCPNYVIIDFRLQTFETIRVEVIVIKNKIRLDCPPPRLID